MFWLERPPYLRWLAAATLVAGAAALDLAGAATTPFPFVAVPLDRGAAVTPEDIEWRDVPVGLLGEAGQTSGVATRPLSPGEPLVAGAVTDSVAIPAGWWAVPVDLPYGAAVGTPVRLIATEPPLDVEGIVAQPGSTGTFATPVPGLVAVPPETAGAVAMASGTGRLVVLVGA